MDNPQFGSGTQLLGDTSALKEAMSRRGIDVSVLAQQGSNSPGSQPMPTGMQQGMGMPPTMGAAVPGAEQPPMPGTPPMPTGTPESELIIQALSERLKHFSNIEKSQVEASKPQPPIM